VLEALYEQRIGLLAWAAGVAVLALVLLSVTRSALDLMLGNPAFRVYLAGRGAGDPRVLYMDLFWFGIAQLLIAVYAITQVARWAADDAEGRLEMTLAQPVPRWRVVAERGLGLALASALLAGVGSVVVAAGAPGQGVRLEGSRLLVATLLLVPLALAFAGVGAAITARLPRLAAPVLVTLAVAGYFLQQIGPLFKWPEWTLNLSVFKLYGTPLTTGVFWNGLYATLTVAALGFGVAFAAMRYRDVGR
jgi:ABC-2 type transport system permease protein